MWVAILAAACVAAPTVSSTATMRPEPTATASQAASATATVTPTETPVPLSSICSPLEGHEIADLINKYLTQPFIPPQGSNRETGHHGVDFAYYRGGPTGGHINGTPIQSVLNGYAAGLGFNPVYGNYLIVETPTKLLPADLIALYPMTEGQSLYLLYAHMQELAPFVMDEPLDCGQVIGLVGGSGDAFFVSDPHLHFETRVGPSGLRLSPMSYYDTSASEEEKEEYQRWRTSGTFQLFDPLILLNYAVNQQ